MPTRPATAPTYAFAMQTLGNRSQDIDRPSRKRAMAPSSSTQSHMNGGLNVVSTEKSSSKRVAARDGANGSATTEPHRYVPNKRYSSANTESMSGTLGSVVDLAAPAEKNINRRNIAYRETPVPQPALRKNTKVAPCPFATDLQSARRPKPPVNRKKTYFEGVPEPQAQQATVAHNHKKVFPDRYLAESKEIEPRGLMTSNHVRPSTANLLKFTPRVTKTTVAQRKAQNILAWGTTPRVAATAVHAKSRRAAPSTATSAPFDNSYNKSPFAPKSARGKPKFQKRVTPGFSNNYGQPHSILSWE